MSNGQDDVLNNINENYSNPIILRTRRQNLNIVIGYHFATVQTETNKRYGTFNLALTAFQSSGQS